MSKLEDLEDTVKYWFNACSEKQKEINKLIEIVTLAEDYISCDKDEKDSIDFLNALYEYRGDNKGNCPNCKQGTMKEMSIYDDMDGMLTCDKCGVRVSS